MRQNNLDLNPIGYVYHDMPDEQVAKARRDLISTIEIDPKWEEALLGLDAYSHLFVIFWMDQVERDQVQQRVHPRGDADLGEVGIFASRMRNRPNPLGMAVVELIKLEECKLTVRKLDAFNGTPVLDIKPYDDYDRIDDVKVPEWWAKRCRQ